MSTATKDLIAEMLEIRKEISLVKKTQIAPLEERKKEIEQLLFEALDAAGTDKLGVKGVGSVSRNEEIVPSVENWEDVYAYIQETGAFHLLNRAMNAAAYRESLKIGEKIDGVVPFTRNKLSVTKAA